MFKVSCTHALHFKDVNLDRCVPLILHGDDAESHRRRSFFISSFASVVSGRCNPFDNRMVLYCLDTSRTCNETIDVMDLWLCWSFAELQEGRWFDKSPWGKQLNRQYGKPGDQIAAGWRGVLVFHRGDEKYIQKVYHMNVGWTSEQVCWTCHASRVSNSPYLYTSFGPCAAHRATKIGVQEFIQRTSRNNAWCRLPGWSPWMLLNDWLHVFDLALICDAAACVTW